MDFFEYAQFASIFVNDKSWWVPYVVGGLCFLIVYVFQAVALFTIAKREGYKNKWMAFVPFFNTYYIGVCGQKNRNIRTVDTKTVALVAAILEVVLVAGFITLYVSKAYLEAEDCWKPTGETGIDYFGQVYDKYGYLDVPQNLSWALWFATIGESILYVVNLVYIFADILVLSCFFQTYASRRYFVFTLTSALFPIQGILFFVVRNNKGRNYRDYIRSEQERQYRMYQQYTRQNFDGNPYNQNPYSRGGYGYPSGDNQTAPPPQQNTQNGGTVPPDDPFAEFGSPKSNDDPFGGNDGKN